MDNAIAIPGRRTGYQVDLAVFHGPLDLLLQLIEQEQLDISLVSLALITDQYLDYMHALQDRHVEDLADFIVVAARLLLIKSRSLLPRPPVVAESDIVDPAEELLRQLQAYKKFKAAALHLAERQTEGHRSYVRLAQLPRIEPGIEHLESVPLDALVAAARRVMRQIPAPASADGIVEPFSITIQDKIDLIEANLSLNRRISFLDLLTFSYTRQEVIVTLLAVLELIKQLKIGAYQDRMFGEIVLVRHPERETGPQ
jgi:segregation and condensation protein A